MNDEHAADRESPADLIPTNSEHSIEKVYFSRVYLDRLINAKADALMDLGDYKNKDIFDIKNVFDSPAEGVRLTTSQTWTAKGLALGQMLHALPLAPGEITRIVVLDWNRKTKGELAADTTQRSAIAADVEQNRAISEITNAVAKESQHGTSEATTEAWAHQWGGRWVWPAGLAVRPARS